MRLTFPYRAGASEMICSPIPVAQPEEIYYSPMIREAVTTGRPIRRILRGIDGPISFPPMIKGIPSRLNHLSRSLPFAHPWNNPQELLQKNTLFPYYVYFDTEEQYQAALSALESDRGSAVFLSLGLASYRDNSYAKFPRYCQQCVESDWIDPGVAYFHRAHQLPGVAVCHLHATVLIDGCEKCGHYPMSDLKQSMPGWCHCSKQTRPTRVIDDDIPLHPGIIWIATESAYLLSATRSKLSCVYSKLRDLLFAAGYCRGQLLDYSAIADALEKKFSRTYLERIKCPAWTENKPSPWIRRYFRDSPGRRPTLDHLLLIGIVASSIDEFVSRELAIKTSSGEVVAAGGGASEHAESWNRSELEAVLKANQYRMEPSAKQLGTKINQLARAALNHGIRVPLKLRHPIDADPAVLDEVRASLSSGQQLATVMRKHRVGEWLLIRILLDSPELFRKHSDLRRIATLQAHQGTLSRALMKKPSITRQEFREQSPAAYEYLTTHDSLWWSQQIQKVKPRWAPPADRDQHRDQELLMRASKALDNLKKMERPVRISRCGLLTRAGINLSLISQLGRYPLTQKFIADNCETGQEFLGRKISWAVASMATEGTPISVNTLRRRAIVGAKVLRSFAQFVVESAKQHGARIENKSFFAMSRV